MVGSLIVAKHMLGLISVHSELQVHESILSGYWDTLIYFGQNIVHLFVFMVIICWYSRRGMSWFDLRPTLNSLYSSWPPPNIIIFHLGNNDLGNSTTLDLLSQIKVDLFQLHLILPNMILFFSEIMPRLAWLLSTELLFLEKIKKKVNRAVTKFMPSVGGRSFRHVDM